MTHYPHRLKARDETKEEQERIVGDCLSYGYEALTGEPLGDSRRAETDPPDRLFTWRGQTIGAEMFELEQFYDARAYLSNLVDAVYERFAATVRDSRFAGVSASLPLLVDIEMGARLKADRKRHPLNQVAREFVELVTSNVRSRDELPDNDFGRRIRIDNERFPALRSLAATCSVRRCGFDLPKPVTYAPYVMIGGVYTYNDEEMISGIEVQLSKKIEDLRRWSSVDRRLLVAHDYPRGYMYLGVGKWRTWLKIAAQRTSLVSYFDELWLVPVEPEEGGPIDDAANVVLIASRTIPAR